MASDGATRSDSFSCAHVAGRPYKVGEHTPDPIRKFLSQSFSNNRYDSEEHLFSRAKNYLEYAGAEKRKLARAQASFQDPASPMIQQAAWMLHLERNSWGTEPGMDNVDRNRVADEVTAAVPYDPSSPYARPPAWLVDPNSTSALSMMIKKEHGPFTLEQTKTAVSTIQEGGLLSDKWKELADRKSHRTAHRHSTVRNGTFPSKTPGGADLSQDPGTRLRDAAGIPVMTGTSGTASAVSVATLYGAQRAGLSWVAPGLDEETATQAMVDLSLQFFRSEGSSPAVVMARNMNRLRSVEELPPKEVEAHQIFSHSYAELDAGVRLTLEGVDPHDSAAVERALVRLTAKAKMDLDADKDGSPGTLT